MSVLGDSKGLVIEIEMLNKCGYVTMEMTVCLGEWAGNAFSLKQARELQVFNSCTCEKGKSF